MYNNIIVCVVYRVRYTETENLFKKDSKKMKLYKRTWAEIDLDNLKHNFEIYRAQIPENTEIMCVVKAFAYGHSDSIVVPYLQEKLGVKWFAVSNLAEAIRMRKKGITGEILILGYTSPDEASELEEFNIIQAVMTADYARQLSVK